MSSVILASNNRGKLAEFNQLLAGCGLLVEAQAARGVPEAEETGLTFVENAILKARNAAVHTGLPAIADDSGLAVDALGGAPGVFSARYAGAEASDADNNARLLQALASVPAEQRGARYHCVLVYLRHADDPTPLICHGQWQGVILDAPRGSGGFGYDPLFFIPELGLSAAELEPATKNRLSHRGQAMAELLQQLKGLPQP